MSLELICEGCHQALHFQDAGGTVPERCPRCGRALPLLPHETRGAEAASVVPDATATRVDPVGYVTVRDPAPPGPAGSFAAVAPVRSTDTERGRTQLRDAEHPPAEPAPAFAPTASLLPVPAPPDVPAPSPSAVTPPLLAPAVSSHPSAAQGGSPSDGVPVEWAVGDVLLDVYEVTGVLGVGGMGKVYRVHHRDWDLDLAVKSPHPGIFQSPRGKEEFIREAETWVHLGIHPHTVSCHYVRVLGGTPRIFAECVDGGSLADWIRDERLYAAGPAGALGRILDVAIQMAWGLSHAHDQGLIHQDVKPANVMMSNEGEAKVTDFSLARARWAAGDRAGPRPDGDPLVSVGGMTPAYCSPEQASRQPLSPATDLWSWAVSVLQLFTGRVAWAAGPFARPALDACLLAAGSVGLAPPLPASVAALLARCLEPDPAARGAGFGPLADELEKVYASEVGRPYPRVRPRGVRGRGGTLNNRAISSLDLGEAAEAERVLGEALREEPGLLEATYNLGLLRWRRGLVTDDVFLRALAATAGPEAALYRGWIQLERGDAEAAVRELEAAVLGLPSRADAWKALGTALFSLGRADDAARALAEARRLGGGAVVVDAEQLRRTLPGRRIAPLERLSTGERPLSAVALSVDGLSVAAGDASGVVRVWRLPGEFAVHTFREGAKEEGAAEQATEKKAVKGAEEGRSVLSLAFVGALERLVAGFEDGTVRAWDCASGARVATRAPDGAEAACMAFAAGTGRGVCGDRRGGLRELPWPAADVVAEAGVAGAPRPKVLRAHRWPVVTVGLSADGRVAASGAQDRLLKVWELRTGSVLATFEGHAGAITSAALSDDGGTALSGCEDGTMRVWDVRMRACLRSLDAHAGPVWSVAFLPGARGMVSAGNDGLVRLWSLGSGRCVRTLEAHGSEAIALAVSAGAGRDGARLASAGLDGKVRVWQAGARGIAASPYFLCRPVSAERMVKDERLFGAILEHAQESAQAGDFREAHRLVRSALALPGFERSPEGMLRLSKLGGVAVATRVLGAWERGDLGSTGVASAAVEFDFDARRAFTGGADGVLRSWDLLKGDCARPFPLAAGPISRLAASAFGSCAVVAGEGREVYNVDSRRGLILSSCAGHTDRVTGLGFIPEADALVTASLDGTLRFWELSGGGCRRTLRARDGALVHVAVSGDGRHLVSVGANGGVLVWDAHSGAPLLTLARGGRPFELAAFSPGGGYVLGGRTDGRLVLWDLSTASEAAVFWGPEAPVRAFAFAPGGGLACVASADGTVTVWRLPEGKESAAVRAHSGSFGRAAFSRDGRFCLAAHARGLSLLVLDWELEVAPLEPEGGPPGRGPGRGVGRRDGRRDARELPGALRGDLPWRPPGVAGRVARWLRRGFAARGRE
ncbi:MAG: serine/threonine protein kinase [Planctomycetes bacterium]|nr:serine/threonine protein kinase [Planctomycetota bacterium]